MTHDTKPIDPDRLALLYFEESARQGRKLGPRDRLLAAFHLTRAWNDANQAGLSKEDFQNQILAALTRKHKSREAFRLSNWVLRRGEDPRCQDLSKVYSNKKDSSKQLPNPQKALEPYLVGVAIAARQCKVDPDIWKLSMLRDLSIWGQRKQNLDILPKDDRPAETLAMLIAVMCAALARRNKLGDVFDAISGMNCRWEIFGERLVPSDDNCMQAYRGKIMDEGEYFEEAFPFPSVSLLRVPYLVGQTRFALAPESLLRPWEIAHPTDATIRPASMKRQDGPLCSVPLEAAGRFVTEGALHFFRDLRLCILPDGHGGFVSAIESRAHVEIVIEAEHPTGGAHHVIGGFEPDLERSLFYARGEDGGLVWPHIQTNDGGKWRVCLQGDLQQDGAIIGTWLARDPETTGWSFDYDPIGAAGKVSVEPWYLTYTPATPDYLRHWLTQDWSLGEVPATSDWARDWRDWQEPESPWNRDLPPLHHLNFPDSTTATWVECCLHNGLLEEAMQAAIDRLKQQTALLQANWQAARDHHAQTLLSRWHSSNDTKDKL